MHIAELSQVDNYILTCDENGILTIPSNASHYLVGNKGSIFFFSIGSYSLHELLDSFSAAPKQP